MAPEYLMALALCLAAALNLSLIGAGLAFARNGGARALPLGSAFAFIVSGVVFIISVDNFGVVAPGPILQSLEFMLTLAAGPVFVLLVAHLNMRTLRPLAVIAPAFLAAAATMVVTIFTGDAPDIRFAVPLQIAYSAAAAFVIFDPEALRRKDVNAHAARLLFVAMAAVHLAQIARMAAPSLKVIEPAVPVIISVLAFGMIFMTSRRLANRLARRRAGPRTCATNVEDLRGLIRKDGAFLDPDYRLAQLSSAAGVPACELSRLINEETGAGFVSFLNDERLKHACDLLRAPEERRTSVEAIALLSGFRSRSAFYRAFTGAYGVTPAVYRKHNS
jgi:AraC-like DNA-binding protein